MVSIPWWWRFCADLLTGRGNFMHEIAHGKSHQPVPVDSFGMVGNRRGCCRDQIFQTGFSRM